MPPWRNPWHAFIGIWEGTDYRRYLARRGFDADSGPSFVRRGFLECWAQPGFHWFWRRWNPALGFLVWRLYRWLGGNGRRPASTLAAFLGSALAHNALVLPWLGWSLTLPVAFLCFGLLVCVWPTVSRALWQRRWPPLLNVPVNVALVLLGFDLGFRVDRLLAS